MNTSRYLIISLTLLASACSDQPEVKSLKYVRTQKVEESDGIQTRIFAGLTQSGVESKISFRVPGTLVHLPVKVGDRVQKGDVIAQLEPNDYLLQVQETEASLMQAKAKERHADVSYTRMRDLYETRSTSRNELDSARAEAESVAASVASIQKKLALVSAQMGYTTLYAPENGSIATVNVEVNENVDEGRPIVVLHYGSNAEVTVSIPEILISKIRNGDRVTVSLDSFPKQKFSGVVTEIGVASSAGTTFPVNVTFTDEIEGIRSGMAADVEFTFQSDRERKGVFIPSNAVIGEGNENFVFVVNSGTVEKRKVEVGSLSNQGLEVFSGVSAEDVVVTAGLQSLIDGMEVRVLE